MGGLLFNTERLQADEYFNLVGELQPKLEGFAKGIRLVKAYVDKKDFGDADFLYTLPNKNIREFLIADLGIDESDIHRNGDVTSFKYKDFQIDLIKIKPESWDSAPYFYDYNDFGNFIGKLYNTFGGNAFGGRQGMMNGDVRLKFTPDGLSVYFYRNSKKQTHVITRDISKIVGFLGLPNYREFQNDKDLFYYIIQSKYFEKRIFQPENMNATNRQRNKKRKGYNDFLEFLGNLDYDNVVNFNENLNYYLSLIDLYFNPEAFSFGTNITICYTEFLRDCILEEHIKKLINPPRIRDEFGIDGTKLGDVVMYLKSSLHGLSLVNTYLLEDSFDKIIKPRVKNYLDANHDM